MHNCPLFLFFYVILYDWGLHDCPLPLFYAFILFDCLPAWLSVAPLLGCYLVWLFACMTVRCPFVMLLSCLIACLHDCPWSLCYLDIMFLPAWLSGASLVILLECLLVWPSVSLFALLQSCLTVCWPLCHVVILFAGLLPLLPCWYLVWLSVAPFTML